MDKIIRNAFPKLNQDKGFKITSKKDCKYNCIAWAAIISDKWMWPPGGFELDGVSYIWPDNAPKDDSIEAFVKAFESFGFEVCSDHNHDADYRKIALYVNPTTNKCTHASRQLRSGYWTSKLGKEEDIQHSDPFSIEGSNYGNVSVIMRKPLN